MIAVKSLEPMNCIFHMNMGKCKRHEVNGKLLNCCDIIKQNYYRLGHAICLDFTDRTRHVPYERDELIEIEID